MFQLLTDTPQDSERWSRTHTIWVGKRKCNSSDLDVYIEYDNSPFCIIRLCAESDEYSFRSEAILWHQSAAIGFGHKVYFVPLTASPIKAISLNLGGYFGYLYPTNNRLLVASATDLRSITPQGNVEWFAEHTGLDGVIIERVDDEFVYGAGEFDPPDGWKQFRIHLHTGMIDWLSTA